MARLRKFSAYRRLERPYTRISKFRTKSYVRARPNVKIVMYDMGNLKETFPMRIILKSKADIQIRDNSIEAARQTANRVLVKKVGKTEFKIKIRVFPHHILRENPLASGAGADRMSTGMKCSFGKSIGTAAQLKFGQPIMQAEVREKGVAAAKLALKRAASKMPCPCTIEVIENPQSKKEKEAAKTETKTKPEKLKEEIKINTEIAA